MYFGISAISCIIGSGNPFDDTSMNPLKLIAARKDSLNLTRLFRKTLILCHIFYKKQDYPKC